MVFSQILNKLLVQTLAEQNRIIKSVGVEDLHYMLLNCYPLRLNEMPDTMSALFMMLKSFCLTSRELSKSKIYTCKYIHSMVHVTAEEEAALNEIMQVLEAQPLETTTVVPLDDQILLSARNWQFWFRLENQKKLSARSSHMIRLNAFQTRMFKNTSKGMKPTSATRPLIL